MARALVGLFLALHGVAHAVGFTASWQLVASADVPFTTTILNGAIDVGAGGTRLIGVLWLAAAAGMIAAAVLVWRSAPHATGAVLVATAVSLAMCLVGLPAAQLGVAIDLAIVGIIAAAAIHDRPVHGAAPSGR
jgi:hypothetical protein